MKRSVVAPGAMAFLAAWLGALAPGCARPMVLPDTGAVRDAGVDSATAEESDADVDAAPSDVDAGVDGGSAGGLSISGGLGTHGGAIPVSGALVIVDDGFDLGGITCNGSLCVHGGFR